MTSLYLAIYLFFATVSLTSAEWGINPQDYPVGTWILMSCKLGPDSSPCVTEAEIQEWSPSNRFVRIQNSWKSPGTVEVYEKLPPRESPCVEQCRNLCTGRRL